MVRIDEETNLGVSVATDCNGRFALLDPYAGAQLALVEACRNVATGGARPLAISDCLNFGSPEDPGVMWQFAEACRGLKDACLELGIPVTGGNVSLYNQTGETAILPTPVVAVLGVINDVTRRTPTGFAAAGERVFLLGETREELSGSEWAHVVHGHLGGLPPVLDLAAEQALASLLQDASRDGVVTSAHDLSDGGLAQALTESTFRKDIGVSVALPGDPFVALFSESAARALVTVTVEQADALVALAEQHGVPLTPLGRTGGDTISVEGAFDLPVAEAKAAWRATLPAVLGS
jgi:phosphoribosylformylglycinamidine synthase